MNTFEPSQKWQDEYDTLSDLEKEKIYKSKMPDIKNFNLFLSILHQRNIGVKNFIKLNKSGLEALFITRLVASIESFFIYYLWYIHKYICLLTKGFTPKSVYFHNVVLHEFVNIERNKK